MRSLSLTLLALSVLPACGNGMSSNDARKAWDATSRAIFFTAPLHHQHALTDETGIEQAMSMTMRCSGGGTVTLDGEFNLDEVGMSFSFGNAFEACLERNITIEGALETTGEIQITEPHGGAVDYQGTLTFSGEVEGSCAIDMHGTFAAGGAAFDGTLCGFDASEVTPDDFEP